MRILMVLDHEFPPDIRVENEIEALVDEGHEVHVACYTRKEKASIDKHLKATIHRIPISDFLYKSSVACLKFPFYFNFWRKFLDGILTDNEFDAIHVHDLPLAKPGYEMAKKFNLSFTLDLHENWPALLRMATHTKSLLGRILSTNAQWERYEKKFCKKADNIVVVVDEAKSRLMEIGIAAEKIAVVSNTLNFDHFASPSTHPDPDYITLMYAGGITEHRGLQFVIEGLPYLKQLPKPIRFWILGTGSYVETLKDKAQALGLQDQVLFEGWKNFEEMQVYFGKADICLIPHMKSDHTDTTIPHKLFQYMYAGKPTIASNCAPIERILNETSCGLSYYHTDPNDFAACIKKLIGDESLMAATKSNGVQAVEKKYNWDQDKEVLTTIYA